MATDESRLIEAGKAASRPDGMGPLADFRTHNLLTNAKGHAVSGGFVTAVSQASRFLLYMASTIVLARLLSPEDFGLVAMVAVLTSFLRLFREGGLSTATVQHENLTFAQVSNLFWINTALGAVTALIGASLAPAIASYYREPRLISITLVLASTFLLSGMAVQHLAVLNRQMRFTAIAIIDVSSMAIGLAVGIAMALRGWGYWSLVGSQCATSLAELMLALCVSRWRPQWPEAKSGTRSLVRFGASMTVSMFLRRLAQSSDILLIGRFYDVGAVGLYSRAMALLTRPMDQFIAPFDAVFVPLLSRFQNDPDRYRRAYLQAINAIALLSFPAAGILLGLSKPLVLVLLGSQWEAVTPMFAGLSLSALFLPLTYAAMWLPVTQRRNRDILLAGVVLSLINILSVVAGLPFGPTGVAVSFSVCGLFLRLPVQFYIVGRSGPVRTRDLWVVFARHFTVYVAVLAASLISLRTVPSLSPLLQLAVCLPVALVAGAGVILAIPSHRGIFANVSEALRTLLPSRREVAPTSGCTRAS
jgi:PST family polysaccharide transporter